MEITEEEEEEQREKKRQSTVREEERPWTPGAPDDTTLQTSQTSQPPVTLNSDLATSPIASNFATTTEPPSFTGGPRPTSPAQSFDDAARRKSLHAARPDLYSYSTYTYGRPKVKLGPRPSLDVAGRPRTSAGTDQFRPVATMPTRLKLNSKGSRKGRTLDTALDQPESPTIEEETADRLQLALLSAPMPADGTPESALDLTRPHTSGGRPSLSSSSAMKSNIPALPPPPSKRNTMTPEKARLMKAMKLREMKKKSSQQPGVSAVEVPSEPSTPELPADSNEETASVENTASQEELVVKNDGRLSMSNADSGVGLDAPNDHISVDTRIESHPTSPVPSSSDNGDSTKASSISETTDETVQERKDTKAGFDSGDAHESESRSIVDQTPDEVEDCAAATLQTENQDRVPVETINEEEATVREDEAIEAGEEMEVETDKETAVAQSPVIPISKFAASSPAQVAQTDGADDMDQSEAAEDEEGTETLKAETIQADGMDQSDAVEDEEGTETLKTETIRAESPDSPPFEVPLSKFSTLEVGSSSRVASGSIPSIVGPVPEPEHEVVALAKDGVSIKEAETSDPETASIETRRSKRKTLEPIRTNLPDKETAHSEANLSDDDDLMEELQSATLHKAQPMTVSKSPMNSVLPGLPPKSPTTDLELGSIPSRPVRAVSSPIRGPLLTTAEGSAVPARTVSSGAPILPKIAEPPPSADLRPKTPKLGSSISQRIKALEMRSGSLAGDAGQKERPSSSFFSVRKTSVRAPSRSPSVVDRTESIKRGTTPSPTQSRESSPETARLLTRGDRSGSMASRLSVFEGGNVPRGRPESVQVTARIVRDPSQPFPKVPELKADAADFGPLSLAQSPLVVDHQRANQAATPSVVSAYAPAPAMAQGETESQIERRPSLLQRRLSKERRSQSQDRASKSANDEFSDETGPMNRPRRRSSLTVVKDFIKDRRGSLLSGKFPSTDNLSLNLNLSPSQGGLASPAVLTSSRSPSSRPPSVHHNSIFPRRLSIGSRRSSIEQKSPLLPTVGLAASPLSPSLMTEASGESDGEDHKRSGSASSAGTNSPNPGGKGGNRASRFMRRLSNSLGSGRKNVTPSISPTVAEENDAEVAAQSAGMVPSYRSGSAMGYAPPSIVSYMGDVNVQFPDNLLWKRRTMCLDSQGFLILSTAQGVSPTTPVATVGMPRDKHLQAGGIKRYHLSDFRPPYTPEMELQELPNSVVLDFVDGSGLQIACEDRAGQLSALHSKIPSSSLTWPTIWLTTAQSSPRRTP